MKTLNEISEALKDIQYVSFPLTIKQFLSAFGLPRPTTDRIVKRVEGNSNEPVFVYRKAVILCSEEISFLDFEQFLNPYNRIPLVLCFTPQGLFVRNQNYVTSFLDYHNLWESAAAFNILIENPKRQKDAYKAQDFGSLVASFYNSLLLAGNSGENSIAGAFNAINLALFTDDSIRCDIRRLVSQPSSNFNELYHTIISLGVKSRFVNDVSICLNGDSFQYFRAIIEFDVDNLDIEVLSSLVYRLFNQDAALYGPQTSYINVQKVIDALILDDFRRSLTETPDSYHSVAEQILTSSYIDPTNGPGSFLTAAFSGIKELLLSIDKEHGTTYSARLNAGRFVSLVDNNIALQLTRLSIAFSIIRYYDNPSIEQINSVYDDLNVVSCNQLDANWMDYSCSSSFTYFFGSPRFLGYKKLTEDKKREMRSVFGRNVADADYCSAWLVKAARCINQSHCKAAFVLTNSVVQGSQVSEIWNTVFGLGCEIYFAYDSFKWKPAEIASTTIGVTVVIVGLQKKQEGTKYLHIGDETIHCQTIGPYLIPNSDTIVIQSNSNLFDVLPSVRKGNMPYDNGQLLIDSYDEYESIINKNTAAHAFIRRIVGSDEFINSIRRWCFWITSEEERLEAIKIEEIKDRIERVRIFRATSAASNKCKANPHKFRESYSTSSGKCSLVIPSVSSENRPYIPMGYINDRTIVSNLAFAVYDCEPWVLSILSSKMHMLWMKTVCGALETRYRYSNVLCYNTFPLPFISSAKKAILTDLSFRLVKVREHYCDRSLGELYNEMPEELVSIHNIIDDNVDSLYQDSPYESDLERLSCLINMYKKRTSQ